MADMPDEFVVSLLSPEVLPESSKWLAEAREALADSDIGVNDAGQVLGAMGAPTDYVLEPIAGGLTICIADTLGTRYWIGSPASVGPVLRWLISLSRSSSS